MTQFAFKTRNLNDTPVKCEVVDADDTFYGNFWVKFRDPNSIAYSALLKRAFDALKPEDYKRLMKPRTDQDRSDSREFMVRFFVDNFITNSEIPAATGDKMLAHSPQTCVAFFMHPDMGFAYDSVLEASTDVANFKRAKEEDAKNA